MKLIFSFNIPFISNKYFFRRFLKKIDLLVETEPHHKCMTGVWFQMSSFLFPGSEFEDRGPGP